MLNTIGNKSGGIEEFIKQLGIEENSKLNQHVFMDDVIKALAIDQKAGELIFEKLASSKNGECTIKNFIDLIKSYDEQDSNIPIKKQVQKSDQKKPETKKVSEPEKNLEESKEPLIKEPPKKPEQKGILTQEQLDAIKGTKNVVKNEQQEQVSPKKLPGMRKGTTLNKSPRKGNTLVQVAGDKQVNFDAITFVKKIEEYCRCGIFNIFDILYFNEDGIFTGDELNNRLCVNFRIDE